MNLPKELEELKNYKNWVCYRLEPRPTKEDPGHMGKVPYNPATGQRAAADDPATWADYQTAAAAVDVGKYNGLGFEFGNSPFFGVDLDRVMKQEPGKKPQITSAAMDILRIMDSYAEGSPSGTGLHILAKGHIPSGRRKVNNKDGTDFEMYETGRYFTVTGNTLVKKIPQERTEQAAAVHLKYWPQPEPDPGIQNPAGGKFPSVVLSDNDRWDEWQNYIHFMDDSEILDAILKSGIGHKIRALFDGDTSAYDNDQSRADMALITYLYCFTGDRQKTDSLFRLSGLYRDKWEQRADYRERAFRWAERNFTPLAGFIEFTAEQRRQYGIAQHRKDNQAFGFDDPVNEPAADPVIAAADSEQIQEPENGIRELPSAQRTENIATIYPTSLKEETHEETFICRPCTCGGSFHVRGSYDSSGK